MKINEGDLVALVGPSGSGKSSLLHIIGLLDEPTNGKILINNQDTSYYVIKNRVSGLTLSNRYYSKSEADKELQNFKNIIK